MREIESLIQRGEKYLKTAQKLILEEDYESSVSRSYYSMFYCAEAILLTKGLSFSSHKGVIAALGEHFIKTGILPREMSKEITRAFEKRQLGDYEYEFVISKEEAEEILISGNVFLGKIKKYLKEEGFLSES